MPAFTCSKSHVTVLSGLPLVLYILVLSFLETTAQREATAVGGLGFPPVCGVCDESRCPQLHYCEGDAIKDHCQCCMVCSDNSFQPHISLPTANNGDACEQVKCPSFKVCVENVQGLPLCECPGSHLCRKFRKKEICGSDGVTYPSRCHMKSAACNQGIRIRRAKRGACKPGDMAAYRKKQRKLKRRKRIKRRKQRQRLSKGGGGEKERDKDRASRRKEKRRRKRRKIGNRNNSNKFSKSRMRRHRKLNLDELTWHKNLGLATWN